MADAWLRLKTESATAYAAFQHYLREGSIDAAYRASNPQANSNHANGQWTGWSAKYEWVARAAAYADHLAAENRALWERRRRELQERDWQQADALRKVVDDAIPGAMQFIRRKTTVTAAGETIITLAFDIVGLTLVLEKASKLQRLSTGDSTENINNLSGAALDAAIQRALDEVANGDKAGHAPAPADEQASPDNDARTAGGDARVQG